MRRHGASEGGCSRSLLHLGHEVECPSTPSLIFVGLGFTAGGFALATWDALRPWLAKLLVR